MFVLRSLLHATYILIHHSQVNMHPKADKELHRSPAFPGTESKLACNLNAVQLVRLAFYHWMERREGMMIECGSIKVQRTVRTDVKRAALKSLPFSLILPALTYGGDQIQKR